MEINEKFKLIIKDKKAEEDIFYNFILENLEEIKENNDFYETFEFLVKNAEFWKIQMFYNLIYEQNYDVEKIIKIIIYHNREDLIQLMSPIFWKDYFYEISLYCVQMQNTDLFSQFIKYSKIKKEDLTDMEYLNTNKILFYASLRNEFENIKSIIRIGGDPNFSFDGVNILSILKRNLFTKSYQYVKLKFPQVIESKTQEIINEEINIIVEDYRKDKRIETLSFYVAKFGGGILIKKDNYGEMLFDSIICQGNLRFFNRLFSVLNDKSENTIRKLVIKSKKMNQIKIMKKLIEESVE